VSDLLLALDCGTTSVRALAVEPSGRVLGRAAEPLATRFPAPGRVEQDAAQMASRGLSVLRRALAEARAGASDVAGLGLVTQRATAVAWSASRGEPLAPALSWQDRRTAARCAELLREGVPADPSATATKLEWWLAHEPAVREAARAGDLRLGTPDAWLAARLTGGPDGVTDCGQAGATGLYDARRGAWSARVLGHLGLEAAWLPRLVPTAAAVGETQASVLGAPVPLAARAGDQQAATFAQAVHSEGLAKLTLGTSAMLDLHAGATPPAPAGGAWPLPLWELADGARAFCLEGTVLTAGAAVDWLVACGLLGSADGLDAAARSVDDAGGVVFVPALQGLGTPFLDPEARGLVGGLTRGSTRAHVARALVEGLAQRCADLCEALPLADGPLRCDGGLARSDLLMQRLADLCGREVWRAAETETTALGAAFLAGTAAGPLAGPQDVAGRLEPPAVFRPAPDDGRRARERDAWRRTVERARA